MIIIIYDTEEIDAAIKLLEENLDYLRSLGNDGIHRSDGLQNRRTDESY